MCNYQDLMDKYALVTLMLETLTGPRSCWFESLCFRKLQYLSIHSIGMFRMLRFLAVLRSFFHSSLLCTFSCHPSPLAILPSSLTSSCHLFLGLPLNLVVPKFIYNTLLGILFSSIHFFYGFPSRSVITYKYNVSVNNTMGWQWKRNLEDINQ